MDVPTTKGNPELRTLLLNAALEVLAEPETPFELRKIAERAGISFSDTEIAGLLHANGEAWLGAERSPNA